MTSLYAFSRALQC